MQRTAQTGSHEATQAGSATGAAATQAGAAQAGAQTGSGAQHDFTQGRQRRTLLILKHFGAQQGSQAGAAQAGAQAGAQTGAAVAQIGLQRVLQTRTLQGTAQGAHGAQAATGAAGTQAGAATGAGTAQTGAASHATQGRQANRFFTPANSSTGLLQQTEQVLHGLTAEQVAQS